MRAIILTGFLAVLLSAVLAATVGAQAPEQEPTITPYDGYGVMCVASGGTLGATGRCDIKVEGLDDDEADQITIAGVDQHGAATTIACDDPIGSRGWAYRCNDYGFLNWNRYSQVWEVWLYPKQVKDSTVYVKVRVSVDQTVWEAAEPTAAVTPPSTRAISHSTGAEPVLATNAVQAAAWNQAVCHNGDTNNDGRCTTSDIGFEFTGIWLDENGQEVPWPEPAP